MARRIAVAVCAALALAGAGCRASKPREQELPGWGTLTDPAGDCTVAAEGGRLTVTVPGGNRNLNPRANAAAPRVLRPVEGDFVARVRVTGDFDPGPDGAGLPAFNGAGLLVWQDDGTYLRVERNRYWSVGRYLCYPPLVEFFRGGAYQNTDPPPAEPAGAFAARSLYLRVDREGGRLTAAYSADGREWVWAQEVAADLPARVLVGVAAVNTSTRPFAVAFDDFSVIPPAR